MCQSIGFVVVTGIKHSWPSLILSAKETNEVGHKNFLSRYNKKSSRYEMPLNVVSIAILGSI